MKYNQFRAMWAISKASLRAITRSPSAIIFSFIFPFIFILIFGFLGDGPGFPTYKIAFDNASDTTNDLFLAIKNTKGVKIQHYANKEAKEEAVRDGGLAATLNIKKSTDPAVPYIVELKSSTASNDKWPQVQNLVENKINEVSNKNYKQRPVYASVDFNYQRDIEVIREYKTIDFILPGQLGFSLLSSGVFGVAFMFFNLRNTMVLKRFFATPITRTFIVLGEGISRVIFQMITALVIILVGHYCFGFTLVNGLSTFLEMLFLSFVGLVVFMGFGFIVSGFAKNDSSIPPFANLITMPQFLLGGTFFSIDAFPHWLQIIAKMLPLTYLNIAMRSVAFEGIHFLNVNTDINIFALHFQVPVILILVLWGIIVYSIAIKVFKWE